MKATNKETLTISYGQIKSELDQMNLTMKPIIKLGLAGYNLVTTSDVKFTDSDRGGIVKYATDLGIMYTHLSAQYKSTTDGIMVRFKLRTSSHGIKQYRMLPPVLLQPHGLNIQ